MSVSVFARVSNASDEVIVVVVVPIGRIRKNEVYGL